MSNSTQLRNDRLDYFLRTVRSYLWCLVIPPILFGGMATVYALIKADTYSARQSLAVRDDLGGDSSFKPGRFDSLDSLKSAQETILEVARKPEVIRAALKKVGPNSSLFSFLGNADGYPDATTIEETQGMITIGAPNGAEFGKTEVVLLGVKAGSRERAELFIKSLLDELELKMREVRTERFRGMESELTESAGLAQLSYDKAAGELQKMEYSLGTDLSALRALNDETPTDGTLQRTLQEYDNLKQATQLEIDKTVKLAELLKKAIDDPAQLVSSAALLDLQPRLLRLLDRLDQAQVDLSIKVGRSTELHPEVQNGRLAIIDIKRQTQREIESSLLALDARIDQLKQRRGTLTADINKVKGRLERLSGMRVQYDKLHRDVEKKREILGQAQESLAEIYALRTSASRVNAFSRIGEPQVSTRPDGPGNRVIVMAGAFGGLVMGIGLMLLLAPGYDPNAGPAEPPMSIQEQFKQTRQAIASHGFGRAKEPVEEADAVTSQDTATPAVGEARPWPTKPSRAASPAAEETVADKFVVKPASQAEIALKPLVSKNTLETSEDLVNQATDSLINASSNENHSFVKLPNEAEPAFAAPTATKNQPASNVSAQDLSQATDIEKLAEAQVPTKPMSKAKTSNAIPNISENVAARIQQVFGATEPVAEPPTDVADAVPPIEDLPEDRSTVTITKTTTTIPQQPVTPENVSSDESQPIDPVRASHSPIVSTPPAKEVIAGIEPQRVEPQKASAQTAAPQATESNAKSAHIKINVNPKVESKADSHTNAEKRVETAETDAPLDPVRRDQASNGSTNQAQPDQQRETIKRASDPTIPIEQTLPDSESPLSTNKSKAISVESDPPKSIFAPKVNREEVQPSAGRDNDPLTNTPAKAKRPNPFMKPRAPETGQDATGFEGVPKTEASLGSERSLFRRPLDSIRTPVESDFDAGGAGDSNAQSIDPSKKKTLRPADIVKAASDQLDTQFSIREKVTSIPLQDSASGNAGEASVAKRPRIETGRDDPNPSPSQAEKVQEILSRLIGDEAEQDEAEDKQKKLSETKKSEAARPPKAANATIPIPDQIKKLGESLSSMFNPLDGDNEA